MQKYEKLIYWSIELIISLFIFVLKISLSKMTFRHAISNRYSRPSRPRCEWRWVEAWSSATTSTTARCGVGGTSSDSSGRPRGPSVAPGASCNPYGSGNPWCKLASRTRSCWDARHEAPPSDPGLRRGRIPIFPEAKRKWNIKRDRHNEPWCTSIIERDNKTDNGRFIIKAIINEMYNNQFEDIRREMFR